jgi:hypothetical protein
MVNRLGLVGGHFIYALLKRMGASCSASGRWASVYLSVRRNRGFGLTSGTKTPKILSLTTANKTALKVD